MQALANESRDECYCACIRSYITDVVAGCCESHEKNVDWFFLLQELENFDIEVMAQRDFTDPYLGESNVTSTFTRIVEETYTRTRGRRATRSSDSYNDFI